MKTAHSGMLRMINRLNSSYHVTSKRLLLSKLTPQASCDDFATSSNAYSNLTQDYFEKSLNVADLKKLRFLKAEVEKVQSLDIHMPLTILPKHWARLLKTPTRKERIQYLWYIGQIERRQYSRDQAKEDKKMQNRERIADKVVKLDDDKRQYQLFCNTLFPLLLDSHMLPFYHHRCSLALQHGPHIVFDTSYIPHLTLKDRSLTLLQLQYCYNVNKVHRMPAALHFTGVDLTHEWFTNDLPRKIEGDGCTVFDISSKSYLDMFPRERLVYLTPYAVREVDEYDSDAVYIVAAMADTMSYVRDAAMQKAQREGIIIRKLPLDRCLKQRPFKARNLPLNNILAILLDAHLTGSWQDAVNKFVSKGLRRPDVEQTLPSSHVKARNYQRRRHRSMIDMLNMFPPGQ